MAELGTEFFLLGQMIVGHWAFPGYSVHGKARPLLGMLSLLERPVSLTSWFCSSSCHTLLLPPVSL